MTIRREPVGYLTIEVGGIASLGGAQLPPYAIDRHLLWYSANRDGFASREVRREFVRGYGMGVLETVEATNTLTSAVKASFGLGWSFLFCLTIPPGWRLVGLQEDANTYYALLSDAPPSDGAGVGDYADSQFPLVDGPFGPTRGPLPLDTDLPEPQGTGRPSPCNQPSLLHIEGFGEQVVTVGPVEYEGVDAAGRPVIVLAPGALRVRGSGTVALHPGIRTGVAAPGHNPYAFSPSACQDYYLRGALGGSGEPLTDPEPPATARRDLRNERGLNRLSGRGLAALTDTAAHPTPGTSGSSYQENEP